VILLISASQVARITGVSHRNLTTKLFWTETVTVSFTIIVDIIRYTIGIVSNPAQSSTN
jgi:hypothetical protein